MSDPSNIKVSVSMITYNHEAYIEQAIKSALMQKADFKFEIVIGEDCSTDSTAEIVRRYKEQYPEVINAIIREKNVGGHQNSVDVMQACKGEYIALLEGDDYWISPDKLQKQVDFLDAHPECAACIHNVMICYQDHDKEDDECLPRYYHAPSQECGYTIDDLLIKNMVPTCSVVYRSAVINELPTWFGELPFGDWTIGILLALNGDIGLIEETLATYRVHSGGVWSSKDSIYQIQAEVRFCKKLKTYLDSQYRSRIMLSLSNKYFLLAGEYLNIGNRKKACWHLFQSAAIAPFNKIILPWGRSKLFLRLCSEKLFNSLKHLARRLYKQPR